jgi:hypothetical protein
MHKLPVDIPDMVWLCRMCNNLAVAFENGGNSCGVADCGGPLIGNCFPKYSGPLHSVMYNYCYSCGNTAEAVMSLDKGGKLGVCRSCLVTRLKVDIPEEKK